MGIVVMDIDMGKSNNSESTTELTQAMTLILLVLAEDARHGYAIMTEIINMTEGEYRVSPGTLYRSISQMLKQGLVEEAPELFNPEHDDERRKYYRITSQGGRVVALELQRMEKLVHRGRSQGIFGRLVGGEA